MREAMQKLLKGESLTEQEMMQTMNCIMEGEATPAQIGSFLTALRLKGETVDELTGCARVMREKAEKIRPNVPFCIDTCGTGGDGAGTFNISTAAAVVTAAGGAAVAKHGNRAMSGKSGSADVLEALGVNIQLSPEQVQDCIEKIGIGFLFAQSFHKAMKHAAGPRRELGFKTVFNMLGPLTNPAQAKGQVLGVFDANLTGLMAAVLQRLGTERALVVHGMDGLDEVTVTAPTHVTELKNGNISTYVIQPEEMGLARAKSADLAGGDANDSAAVIRRILDGGKGPARDIVLANSAASLYVAGIAESIKEGVGLAESIIDSGKARAKLEQLAAFTNTCAAESNGLNRKNGEVSA